MRNRPLITGRFDKTAVCQSAEFPEYARIVT